MCDKVVVLTLNYNQNQFTLDCIDSLINLDYQNIEIIVIDNGSEEHNKIELEKSLPSGVIFSSINPNRGYVGGINYGLELAIQRCPAYILIMNNDAIIDKHAISALVEASKMYNDNAIVTGKVYHFDNPNKLQYVGSECISERFLEYRSLGANENDIGQYEKISERYLLDDIFWLIPFEVYKKLGPYSECFYLQGESTDYSIRAKKNGVNLIYTPYAKIWHKGSATIGGRDFNPELAFWRVKSSLILRYLHLKRSDFSIYLIKQILNIIRTFLVSAYHSINGDKNRIAYAIGKFNGLVSFFKWLIIHNGCRQYN